MNRITRPKARGAKRTPTATEPIRLIVRRGATKRAQALAAKAAGLNVEIAMDRRVEDRRRSTEATAVERRSGDRRNKPPYTWDVADFAVVVPKRANKRRNSK
jgi:hypothetical protein